MVQATCRGRHPKVGVRKIVASCRTPHHVSGHRRDPGPFAQVPRLSDGVCRGRHRHRNVGFNRCQPADRARELLSGFAGVPVGGRSVPARLTPGQRSDVLCGYEINRQSRLLEGFMKYMLLIYMSGQPQSDAERECCFEESIELARQLEAKGQFVASSPLQPVTTATTVRVRDGKRVVTDGPFAETREQLGGYFLIDAEDLDTAIDIAARIPASRWGTVEVRPLLEIPALAAIGAREE